MKLREYLTVKQAMGNPMNRVKLKKWKSMQPEYQNKVFDRMHSIFGIDTVGDPATLRADAIKALNGGLPVPHNMTPQAMPLTRQFVDYLKTMEAQTNPADPNALNFHEMYRIPPNGISDVTFHAVTPQAAYLGALRNQGNIALGNGVEFGTKLNKMYPTTESVMNSNSYGADIDRLLSETTHHLDPRNNPMTYGIGPAYREPGWVRLINNGYD